MNFQLQHAEGLAVPFASIEHSLPQFMSVAERHRTEGETMTISLYDISVPNYLQGLAGVSGFLKKGAAFCEEKGIDPNEIVGARVIDDMLPMSFQIASVAHHSAGTIEGIQQGEFVPPKDPGTWSYTDLQKVVEEAREKLTQVKPETVNACLGKDMIFSLGKHKLPFTAENFVLSFSLPNFYFHATTAYDILRGRGVPLGKVDFLGQMRMKM